MRAVGHLRKMCNANENLSIERRATATVYLHKTPLYGSTHSIIRGIKIQVCLFFVQGLAYCSSFSAG